MSVFPPPLRSGETDWGAGAKPWIYIDGGGGFGGGEYPAGVVPGVLLRLVVEAGRRGGLGYVRNHTLAVLPVAAELSSDLAYDEGLVADSEAGTRGSGQRCQERGGLVFAVAGPRLC